MKKKGIYYSCLALILSAKVQALGLGDIEVESSLDQPFLAEIPLIDAQVAFLNNIKIGLASQQTYEQLGISVPKNIGELRFEIVKDKNGKLVIRIHSLERITEPYMQFVIDLTWSKGQLYRAYTVLLDPPGYRAEDKNIQIKQLKKLRHHLSNTRIPEPERKNSHYGPTIANENIWQIAQQFKSVEAILPQVVLAILGKNPDAFTEGNLNGLKKGVYLDIPSAEDIAKVPADMATMEVMAHDKAWNEKTTINHILTPPYNTENKSTDESTLKSNIASVPNSANQSLTASNTFWNGFPSNQGSQASRETNYLPHNQTEIVTSAVNSYKNSNTVLIEQLRLMQIENKVLQQQISNQTRKIDSMNKQVNDLQHENEMLHQIEQKSHFNWLWLLLLAGLGFGGGAWYYQRKCSTIEHTDYPVFFLALLSLLKKTKLKSKNKNLDVTSDFADSDLSQNEESTATNETLNSLNNEHQNKDLNSNGLSTDLIPKKANPLSESKTKNDLENEKEQAVSSLPTVTNNNSKPRLESEFSANSEVDNKSPQAASEVENDLTKSNKTDNLKPYDNYDAQELDEINSELAPTITNADKVNTASANEHIEKNNLHSKKYESNEESQLEFEKIEINPIKEKTTDQEVIHDIDNYIEFSNDEPVTREPKNNTQNESFDESALEFESGLINNSESLPLTTSIEDDYLEQVNTDTEDNDNTSLSQPLEDRDSDIDDKKYDTLLDLAQTYIGMEDDASALLSLEEVSQNGNPDQKLKADQLIKEINNK